MLNFRQQKIIELIKSQNIETQDELQALLLNLGIDVTQATISRDIKKLKIIKAPYSTGKNIYTVSSPISQGKGYLPELSEVINNSVYSVDTAMNLVVLKCYAGMASAVCASIDNTNTSNIVGSIAGDDTIFLATKSELVANEIKQSLESYKKKG